LGFIVGQALPQLGQVLPLEEGGEMKIVLLVARILLGLTFFVFGLNGFLGFIPTPPLHAGLAGQFVTVLFK